MSALSVLKRAEQRARASRWAAVLPKILGFIGGFALLTAIGAGVSVPWVVGTSGTTEMLSAAALPQSMVPSAPSEAKAAEPETLAAAALVAPPMAVAEGTKDVAEPPAKRAVTADGKVILNLAEAEDLTKLPGIGPKRADSILALRKRLGQFKRVEDLLRVKGIGRKALARLKPLVVVNPPPPPADSPS